MRQSLIFLLTGWAGFFIMALELLGGRILFPYFGGTINIWGALISVFLCALSLGYVLGGQLSRHKAKLAVLAVFLCAAAAFVIPVAVAADKLLALVFTFVLSPSYGALLAALLLFATPAALLGMVTPYAMRLLVGDQNQTGSTAGWLYFAGTVGSALGTIITSFYLVLWFQVAQILVGLILISFFFGLVTFWVAGRHG